MIVITNDLSYTIKHYPVVTYTLKRSKGVLKFVSGRKIFQNLIKNILFQFYISIHISTHRETTPHEKPQDVETQNQNQYPLPCRQHLGGR